MANFVEDGGDAIDTVVELVENYCGFLYDHCYYRNCLNDGVNNVWMIVVSMLDAENDSNVSVTKRTMKAKMIENANENGNVSENESVNVNEILNECENVIVIGNGNEFESESENEIMND